MGFGIFERVSAWLSAFCGFYSFGHKKDEPGIYVSDAMAKNFSLHSGMISERELSDFIMRSVGGVNGMKIRHADNILFKKANGQYVLASYAPIEGKKRGYIREIRNKPSDKCPPLSCLPNYIKLYSAIHARAGDAACILNITPRENRGEVFDYACISAFFDTARRELEKPSVFWLGERDYLVIIEPDEMPKLYELCRKDYHVGGRAVSLSVSLAELPCTETFGAQTEKLAFCQKRLKRGVAGGKYVFSTDEFRAYCESRVDFAAIEKRIKEREFELMFTPTVSVKSGNAKYFTVIAQSAAFTDACILNGLGPQLDVATAKALEQLLIGKELPELSYCLPIYGDTVDEKSVSELCSAVKKYGGELYVELNTRALRAEKKLSESVALIKRVGAVPAVRDLQCEFCELPALQRMGFEIIGVTGQSRDQMHASAKFCRTYNIECAVFGTAEDGEFIELRRLGVDLCEGPIFSEPVAMPEKTLYREPCILCDEEPEPEPIEKSEPTLDPDFDLTRFAVKTVYGFFEKKIDGWIAPQECEPAEPLEPEEYRIFPPAESGEPLEELEPCELEEGLGAKKKRKKADTPRRQKKRQKKEIKKGKLKKLKKMKLDNK